MKERLKLIWFYFTTVVIPILFACSLSYFGASLYLEYGS